MAADVREFFEGVPGRVDRERIRGQRATYRFDITGAGSWHVALDDGDVRVRESGDPADCVVRADERTFLRIVRREQNPLTAYMTGRVKVEGDLSLLSRLRDILG